VDAVNRNEIGDVIALAMFFLRMDCKRLMVESAAAIYVVMGNEICVNRMSTNQMLKEK